MFGFEARTAALLSAIARAGTVSGAARLLGADASNALRHLRAAEARAGARLVDRARGGSARGVARLTAAGAAVLAQHAGRAAWVGRAGAFDAERGTTPIHLGRRVLHAAGRVPSGPVEVRLRPEDVLLERPVRGEGRSRSARNAFPVRVEEVEEAGEGTYRLRLVAGALRFAALVTRGAVRDLRLREGSRVVAVVKATALVAEPLART